MTANSHPVGLVLGSAILPEELVHMARLGEGLGFGELWFTEDYFFTGAISGAAVALAATKGIPIGIGILSAMVRHPAVLAMEISTASRLFPGRVWAGIGLGLPVWIRQMRLHPRSPLGAMRECLTSVRRLLEGEELTVEGENFGFDRVTLTYPSAEMSVPLYLGGIGPKMLQLSGEIADGTVLSGFASIEYVTWAREQIAVGQARAGRRTGRHRVAAFVIFSTDLDSRKAKEALRAPMAFYLAAMGRNALTDTYGITQEVQAMVERGGAAAVERELPKHWLDDLVVAGDPEECAVKIRRYLEAGADSVILSLRPRERAEELARLAAAEILPRLA